jgi:putative NADH-flavin reductase
MKIVVGAAGMVGSRITSEASRRGHAVTAVVRAAKPAAFPEGVTAMAGNADDREQMTRLFSGSDVIVGATRPVVGQEHTVATTTTALLDAAAAAATRLLIVGGAGPLHVPGRPDRLVIDDPDYVPAEWRTIAAASVAQLDACRAHGADWVYLSPPATLEPGPRTGTYRRGTTTLLTGADGTSRISVEDLAVAALDEIEEPHAVTHFTVGY